MKWNQSKRKFSLFLVWWMEWFWLLLLLAVRVMGAARPIAPQPRKTNSNKQNHSSSPVSGISGNGEKTSQTFLGWFERNVLGSRQWMTQTLLSLFHFFSFVWMKWEEKKGEESRRAALTRNDYSSTTNTTLNFTPRRWVEWNGVVCGAAPLLNKKVL